MQSLYKCKYVHIHRYEVKNNLEKKSVMDFCLAN